MTKYCYLNGKIIPLNKAGISLNDLGILRGYGVFDFLRTYNGRPFFLKEHLRRLKSSAKILNLKLPGAFKELAALVNELLLKNKFKESTVRIVLTGGRTNDGITYRKPTLFILVEKLRKLPPSVYQKGVKLITYEYQREIPKAKMLNYITAASLQNLRRRKKAFEILYTSKGQILEATTSNFFIFKNNTLITPKDKILLGITRDVVIKLAQSKFKVEERDIPLRELSRAAEAFITATSKEIVPVVKIDSKLIGNGKVGQNTKYLMNLFQDYTKKYLT